MDEYEAKREHELDKAIDLALDHLGIDLKATEKTLNQCFEILSDITRKVSRAEEDILYLQEMLQSLQDHLGL